MKPEQLLRDTFHVVALPTEVDPDEIVRAWLPGVNPQLDDAAPAEEFAEGLIRDVMAAARVVIAAGWTGLPRDFPR